MSLGTKIAEFCADRHRLVTGVMVGVTVLVGFLAALPSFAPQLMPFTEPIHVDTDPENMLAADEPVRVFHREMKKQLSLHDIVVVGVVNEQHPDGVFNAKSLRQVYELTEFAKTLRWDIDGQSEGVVEVDLIAPSTVDNIEQAGLGTVSFEWLMPKPPETDEQARAVREKAQKIPFLNGTLVSEDGKAVCLYLPLTRKDLSHRVYVALQGKIDEFEGEDEFYITGLPVAEDVFGVEMFIQMAISAPAAMLVIFLLMLVFFRKLVLIVAPLIIAMVSVILTMGTLIIADFPVHIMSSMIPIFIMPIAVLDAVHILSEFFDRYQATRDRRATITHVMDELFMPMLYTSLTSTAGFASLALTPIPPVQVFGVFVGMGIMSAWLMTMTFMPAYVMFISPKTLESFGATHTPEEEDQHKGGLNGLLQSWGRITYRQAKPIMALTIVVLIVAGIGISKIEINDNPVKWFTASHPIRVADRVLNEHFGGTYMAYLALTTPEESYDAAAQAQSLAAASQARAAELAGELPPAPEIFAQVSAMAGEIFPTVNNRADAFAALEQRVREQIDSASGDAAYAWDEAGLMVDEQRQQSQLFKDPELLRYVEKLQTSLVATGVVGKSNSLADLVKTVHRELFEGSPEAFTIPDQRNAVAQCLITYQNSHRADDLWHFVTPDYRTTSIWAQLKTGDNKDMQHVVAAVDQFVAENPPPFDVKPEWFGLTYINVIWQQKMVMGMLQAFAGSFLVVFLLMTVLFRSAIWGLLSMIPLTVTIAAIYGAIGLVGKAYDMPVAVLSSLSLGLAVDFAIHFLARSRRVQQERGVEWREVVPTVFGEPARAIVRNIIVIATGFTPLLLAPLMPYKTVGVLLATILLVSGVATLFILPAMIRIFEARLFSDRTLKTSVTCDCVTCASSSVALAALIIISLNQYWSLSLTGLAIVAVIVVPASAVTCGLLSRRSSCHPDGANTGGAA
jgi:predicted RND superfamily exporter protein